MLCYAMHGGGFLPLLLRDRHLVALPRGIVACSLGWSHWANCPRAPGLKTLGDAAGADAKAEEEREEAQEVVQGMGGGES